jgi:hypothetical protein
LINIQDGTLHLIQISFFFSRVASNNDLILQSQS